MIGAVPKKAGEFTVIAPSHLEWQAPGGPKHPQKLFGENSFKQPETIKQRHIM